MTATTTRTSEALTFLQDLYATATRGHLVVWTADKATRSFSVHDPDGLERAATHAVAMASLIDTYVGVGLQTNPPAGNERGKASTIAGIPGLWVDLDIKGPAHVEQALPPTVGDALSLLTTIPLPPTFVIDSGNGVYVWWAFKELWLFDSDDERRAAASLVDRFQTIIRTKATACGWKIESTADLARVLRIPGMLNHKLGEGKAVRIIQRDDSARYNPEDFAPFLPNEEELGWVAPETPVNESDFVPAKLPMIMEKCAWMRHCRDDAAALKEPEWYAMLSIAGRCENAYEVAHELSSVHPGYTTAETDKKLQQAITKSMPRTCRYVHDKLGGEAYCDGCANWGIIKTPVVLGRTTPRPITMNTGNGHHPEDVPPSATPPDTTAPLRQRFTERAKAAPKTVVRELIDDAPTFGALALVARDDPRTFESWLLELREHGVTGVDITTLKKLVQTANKPKRNPLRAVGTDEPNTLPRVVDAVSDAPVTDALVVPHGWRLSVAGIQQEHVSQDGEFSVNTVAHAPILISGLLTDIGDGAESVRLIARRDGRWIAHTVGRAVVANARELVSLAAYGFPITSGNARDLVAYLSDFEAANIGNLPRARVSQQLGWQGDGGQAGFLWGKTLLREDAPIETLDVDATDPRDWREGVVTFRGADAGDDQLAAGFYAAGSFDSWREAVAPLANYPRSLLALYAALTPPLLDVLGCPNFVVDWSFTTSTGKTTTLRAAASAWGNPDEHLPDSVLHGWDATKVWLERASAVLNGLPLMLDETKRAKTPALVSQAIYDVSSGRGKGRGSPKGLRRAGSWTTVLMSTGEQPATSFTATDGGTHARVVSVWGPPFGGTDAPTAAIVRALNAGVVRHFGHAGPRLVQYVMARRKRWETWRTAYQNLVEHYGSKAGADPVAGRLAGYFAALESTAMIAHNALDLPWEYQSPIAALWDELSIGAANADRAAAALFLVLSWARGNQHAFYGRHEVVGGMNNDDSPRVPSQGWAGVWSRGENWETIAFLPHRLKQVLADHDFDVNAILPVWRDRGWLEMDGDRKRNTKLVRVYGERSRCIVLRREAVVELEGGAGD